MKRFAPLLFAMLSSATSYAMEEGAPPANQQTQLHRLITHTFTPTADAVTLPEGHSLNEEVENIRKIDSLPFFNKLSYEELLGILETATNRAALESFMAFVTRQQDSHYLHAIIKYKKDVIENLDFSLEKREADIISKVIARSVNTQVYKALNDPKSVYDVLEKTRALIKKPTLFEVSSALLSILKDSNIVTTPTTNKVYIPYSTLEEFGEADLVELLKLRPAHPFSEEKQSDLVTFNASKLQAKDLIQLFCPSTPGELYRHKRFF